MLNVSFLSGMSAAGLLLLGLASRGGSSLPVTFWLQVVGLMVACYVFYTGSIGQAMAWGDLMRGAFDLYRGKLLAQMGFTQKPADMREERALWRAISLQMIFGDPPAYTRLPLLRYAADREPAGQAPALAAAPAAKALPRRGKREEMSRAAGLLRAVLGDLSRDPRVSPEGVGPAVEELGAALAALHTAGYATDVKPRRSSTGRRYAVRLRTVLRWLHEATARARAEQAQAVCAVLEQAAAHVRHALEVLSPYDDDTEGYSRPKPKGR
jgi:hypothetical protein